MRFTPVPPPSPRTASGGNPLRAAAFLTVLLLALGATIGWILGRGARTELEPQVGPVVVAMRRIGNLHTASFTMKDVLTQQSQQEPGGWLASLPGAPELMHWATRNRALVVAQGTVEAGVDLSQISAADITSARSRDGAPSATIRLPAATIYPPNVTIRVENSEAGPFWRDENIVPKAQQEAAHRFLEAARDAGIRQQAEENAERLLGQMVAALGYKHVSFVFPDRTSTAP